MNVANTLTCRTHRFSRFSLPLSVADGVFHNQARISAQEYRHLGMLLPHLLSGVPDMPANVMHAACLLVRLQLATEGKLLPPDAAALRLTQSPGLTRDVVRLIERLAVQLTDSLRGFLPPSAMRAVKLHHVLEHLADDIRAHGAPRHWSAERYEAEHAHVKVGFW
jgi:hypothetical protein